MLIYSYELGNDTHPGINELIGRMYQDFFLKLSSPPGSYWIAGGSLLSHFTGAPISDIDVYCNSSDVRSSLINQLGVNSSTKYKSGPNSAWMTNGSQMYDFPIRTFSSPEETIRSFDLDVCQIALDQQNLYVADSFFFSIASRTMNLSNLEGHPQSILDRILRYSRKGFSLTPESQKSLVSYTNSYNLNHEAYLDERSGNKDSCSGIISAVSGLEKTPAGVPF